MKALSQQIAQSLLRLARSRVISSLKSFVPKSIRQRMWNFVSSKDEFLVMGSRMFIPVEARQRDLVMDCYEPEVSASLRRLLRPGMVFCDIGANIGVFALLGARLVGPQGRVFSFEPVPANFVVLVRNIELNHCSNVVCFQKAVADRNGTCRLLLSRFCGSHSLIDEPPEFEGSVDVETIRLDSVPGIDRIDVLKMDVEGAELEVFRGLGSLRPHVIFEYNSERLSRRGLSILKFLDQVRALDYDVTNLDLSAVDTETLANESLRNLKEVTMNFLASPLRVT